MKYDTVVIKMKINMNRKIMHRSFVKKDLKISQKADLLSRKLVTLVRTFDMLEKVVRRPKTEVTLPQDPLPNEYNRVLSTQKKFCCELLKAMKIIKQYSKKYNEHLVTNDIVTGEISQQVEDLVDKFEDGIIHVPPVGGVSCMSY